MYQLKTLTSNELTQPLMVLVSNTEVEAGLEHRWTDPTPQEELMQVV